MANESSNESIWLCNESIWLHHLSLVSTWCLATARHRCGDTNESSRCLATARHHSQIDSLVSIGLSPCHTAESHLFYRALLQKRPIILRSLLIVATPYHRWCLLGCRVYLAIVVVGGRPNYLAPQFGPSIWPLGPSVWPFCLAPLFGPSVWPLCLAPLFGPSVWPLCLVYLAIVH